MNSQIRLAVLTLFILLLAACQPEATSVSVISPAKEAIIRSPNPTLEDLWNGSAEFLLEVSDTGLPMGESDTIELANGHLWSYVHASDRSAGVRDQCGQPAGFPGCVVIYRSYDGGQSFSLEQPVCQFSCNQCPCDLGTDHIGVNPQFSEHPEGYFAQQQYPRTAVHETTGTMYMVYETFGGTQMRLSLDGLAWSDPVKVGDTGHWRLSLRECPPYERIGTHPFVPPDFECLSGGPPGLFIEGDTIYVLVGAGQAPGHMECYKGTVGLNPERYTRCENNPLFTGAPEYGPLEVRGEAANPWWDFRTISSADVHAIGVGPNRRYYMVYEGLRGPGPGDPGDTQFGLGFARSLTSEFDGPWQTWSGNPLLVDSPANIGIGHADIIVLNGETILYTSLDGIVRSRLKLVWKDGQQ